MRLFVLLCGALVMASLVPLLVSDGVLIRRNQRTLETLEEKYLTRSSSAIADHVAAFYVAARERLNGAGASLRLAGRISGGDPFKAPVGPRILESALAGQSQVIALRGVNFAGSGSFVGPPVHLAQLDYEFRKGFEAAQEGGLYQGKPFQASGLGHLSVIAAPVLDDQGGEIGVVEALVSWQPLVQEFLDEARRELKVTLVDRQGEALFPESVRGADRRGLTLVRDFMRFPARLTRSEKAPGGGGAVLASIAPVGQPDWGVLVERDRALAFASVTEMIRDTLVWSALALAGALLLGVVFARRLSDPIARLAESTRAISEGQYGSTVEVGGTAEIADLSESFNRMSGSIEVAFEQIRRAAQENHELFLSSIRALAEAIDAKDPYTRGHSERVATYAATISVEMGLAPEDVDRIRLSALLHDVGKIGVDDRIIRKPTALTEEEFEAMKTHPIKGAAIMSAIPQLADVIPGMRHHHEKWTGGGYPDGLAGERIPLQARIVSVADTFDAMTTTRPYQKAMEIDFVVDRIRQFAGVRYDPRVVQAFLRAYEKGDLMPIPVDVSSDEDEMQLREAN
jgi:HD-GYP domain-containing protein (c-di-GMP phosphodiesterase class II)